MPAKRRAEKARHFDETKAMQLLAGPDVHLVMGVGYRTAKAWAEMPALEQQDALTEMREDWARHGAALTAYSRGDRSAFQFKPWNFVGPSDGLTWSEERFGPAPMASRQEQHP